MRALNRLCIPILLGLTIWIWVTNSSGSEVPKPKLPTVENASLDLSHWDPSVSGPLFLDGDWGFSWQEFLTLEEIKNLKPQNIQTIAVPSKWTEDSEHSSISKRTPFGFGTYFLKIKFSEYTQKLSSPLSILPTSLCCAASLEIWDPIQMTKLGSFNAGQVSATADKEIPNMNQDQVLTWEPQNIQEAIVILHLSNHLHARPGFLAAPTIGLTAKQSKEIFQKSLLDASILGTLIIIALYHFILFLQRRDDKNSLAFAILCAAISIRQIVTSGIIDSLKLSSSLTSYTWVLRVEYISIPIIMMAGLYYLNVIYPNARLNSFIKYWGMALGSVLTLFTCLTPSLTFSSYINLYMIHLLGCLIIMLTGVFIAVVNKQELSKWMFSSVLIVALGGVNDILYAKHILELGYLGPYCFIIFILFQSSIISKTFARAMYERDAANQALIQTYRQLDEELLKREKLIALNEHLETEIGTASEQLIQADKMSTLGQLVAGVAHEIAGPTNYIGMATTLITGKIDSVRTRLKQLLNSTDPEAVKVLTIFTQELNDADEELRQINNGVDKIKDIHSALRNHGRIDPKPMHNIEIRPIIDETLVILGSKTKLVDTMVSTENAPEFTGRRSQLGQVLTNLIGNAADATEEVRLEKLDSEESFTPKILIEAKAVEHNKIPHLEVAVHDNGTGIPEDIREKILEPFFTTKEVGKGTGLGMPIILRIIRGHHGDLVIEDSAELGGACLRFWIPVTPPQKNED